MLLLSENSSTDATPHGTTATPTTGTTVVVEDSEAMVGTIKLFLSLQQPQQCPEPEPEPEPEPKQGSGPLTPTTTTVNSLLPLVPQLSSAKKVFQIPELADNIALFLRPIYISQLRLVSRALYIAYRPHLRLHLHRGSTDSWTSFPTLQLPAIVDTTTTSINTKTTADKDKEDKEKTKEKEACDKGEGEVKLRTLQDNEAVVVATAIASAETILDLTRSTESTTEVQCPNPHSREHNQDQDERPPIPIPASKPKSKAVGNGYGYQDGLTYGSLVEALTTDLLDNLERLIPIMRQCPNIHTLSITRWNKELQVFENLLHHSPHLKTLSVAFYTTVDLTEFLGTLTGTLTGTGSSKAGDSGSEGRQISAGSRTLQSLDIKHRVPDINPVEWKALKAALDVLPALRNLSLTGVEFTGGADNNGEVGVGGAGINQHQGLAAILNGGGGHPVLTPWLGSTSNSTFSTAAAPSLQQPGIFPNIKSISLSVCDCPATVMQEINRIFPKLTSLELNRCRSNWFQVFEPDPSMPASPHLGPTTASVTSFVSPASNAVNVSIGTGISSSHISHSTSSLQPTNAPAAPVLPRVPFPELRHLKLTARQGYEILLFNLDLVAHRPYLTSIEIYDMSLKIETLRSLVSVCKSEGRFLKRWAHSVSGTHMSLDEIQTYFLSCDEIQTNEVPSLSQVQHLYVQKPGLVSFASTLTSLHIGDEGNFRGTFAMRPSAITTWNEILQRLPRLRILKIDQLLKGYCLFQHLGRQPVVDAVVCNNSNHSHCRRVTASGGGGGDEENVEVAIAEEEEGSAKAERELAVGSCETSEDAWSIQASASSPIVHNHFCRNTLSSELTLDANTATGATATTAHQSEALQSDPIPVPTSTSMLLPTISSPPPTTTTTTTTTATTSQLPKLETPFLEELHVAFEWDLDISTADLDREVIQRFRLLENLFVTSIRKPDGFVAFAKEARPGLSIVHRRHETM
ncbi:hypothetical protein EC991_000762 [Linnemannia zychae]|nr:hypothetical protein EC991_000762 [Linnemannia zychae]